MTTACNCHVPEGNLKRCPLHGPQRRPLGQAVCAHGEMRRDERFSVTVLTCPKGCVVEVSHT